MAERLDSEVRNFLRPSEEVKIALDTLTVQRDGGNDVGQASPSPDWKRRRVLAVVTHRNQSENQEGRCVLCSTSKAGFVTCPGVLPASVHVGNSMETRIQLMQTQFHLLFQFIRIQIQSQCVRTTWLGSAARIPDHPSFCHINGTNAAIPECFRFPDWCG